jgi:hypothetical protein
VLPLSHQEIARARHADLLREATQARLAMIAREGIPGRPAPVQASTLRWTIAAVRKAFARRAAVRTA